MNEQKVKKQIATLRAIAIIALIGIIVVSWAYASYSSSIDTSSAADISLLYHHQQLANLLKIVCWLIVLGNSTAVINLQRKLKDDKAKSRGGQPEDELRQLRK